MNSKVLQDKINGIESDQGEMRLLKKGEKPSQKDFDHHAASASSCPSSVSLKHYDQVTFT